MRQQLKSAALALLAAVCALLLAAVCALLLASCGETAAPVPESVPAPTSVPATTAPAPLPELYLNEYATNKTQTLLSDSGEFVSWVELYNAEDAPVALKGFALSDEKGDRRKWVFPAVTIDAGDFLVVYLSGEERSYDGSGQLHADFKLNGKEDGLFLFAPNGDMVDQCKVYPLFSNLTCGRTKDGAFAFFSAATPGKKNTGVPFDSVDSAALAESKTLLITEVAAVNTDAPAPGGVCCDFIELYNASDKDVALNNYLLSDRKAPESFLPLPKKTLAPGDYLAVYCTDEKNVGGVTLDLGLNRCGETVYLMKKSGAMADSLTYGRLTAGYSCGRNLRGSTEPVYFSALTPGKQNAGAPLAGMLLPPELSRASGYAKAGDTVKIACDAPVYYTTDGSVPTESDARYTEPLRLKKTTVLRARAIADGAVPSETVTATYLLEEKHTLPVVCLAADQDDLFSESRGILATGKHASAEFPYLGANYWQDWERPLHFEYLSADGVPQVNFDGGVQVFGQFSRALEQKSLAVYLRDVYGPGEIVCPFFENGAVNVFSSLVLRNSGQDFSSAHLRDAFCAMAMKGQVNVDLMDYQPVAVYLNGEYYGLYDLREKLNGDYLETHYGVEKSNVDLIKGSRDVQLGSTDAWDALIQYVKTHDLRTDEAYEYVKSQVDIDNLIEYWMCESFFANTDTGNIRFWREKTDGKWRWMFFDVDWALYPTTYTRNTVRAYLDPQGHGVGRAFSTTLMVNLMKNASFRKRVLTLHKKHLATTFDKDRLLTLFDRMVAQIEPEMQRHTARWKTVSYTSWQRSVQELRAIVEKMPALFKEKMKTGFSMTEDEARLYLG